MGERACCVLTTGRHPLNRKFNKQHHQPINNNTRSLIIALEAKITAAPTMQVTILACLAAVLVLAPAVRAQVWKVCESIENCETCVVEDKCHNCMAGYTTTEQGACQPCDDENCILCNPANTAECWSCNIFGYMRTEDLTCKACDDKNCGNCPETSVCENCVAGYESQQGVCERCEDVNCNDCPESLSTCTSCAFGYKLSEQKACESKVGECFDKTAKTHRFGGECMDRHDDTTMLSYYLMLPKEMTREKCAELCKINHPQIMDQLSRDTPCMGFDYNFAAEPFEDCRCWFHTEANIAAEELRPNENVEFWQKKSEACEGDVEEAAEWLEMMMMFR